MIQDYFKLAYKNLLVKKTRSILTVIGIFLAILTIFVLISLSLGLNNFVNEQFEALGTNKFFIQPKGQAGAPGSQGAVELTIKDAEIVEKVKGVGEIAYLTAETGKIGFKDYKFRYYYVLGLPAGKQIELIFKAMNIEAIDGRLLKSSDSKKVVIGYNYKYGKIFDKPVEIRSKIKINDIEFDVIGVLEQVGNPQDDAQVYISLDDFKEVYNSGERVDLIWVETKPGEDIESVAKRTEKELMDFRDVDEKTIDFSIQTPKEMIAIFNNILNILLAFLIGIGSISILVGGIGIANTMYTSVLERNKEIGTMKAIGAKNSDILLIFVIESGILGLIGGILGLIGGIGIAKSIEYISVVLIGSNIIRASMNPYLIIGVLGFAFLIGILSGLTPSYQASKLKPVDALRYE